MGSMSPSTQKEAPSDILGLEAMDNMLDAQEKGRNLRHRELPSRPATSAAPVAARFLGEEVDIEDYWELPARCEFLRIHLAERPKVLTRTGYRRQSRPSTSQGLYNAQEERPRSRDSLRPESRGSLRPQSRDSIRSPGRGKSKSPSFQAERPGSRGGLYPLPRSATFRAHALDREDDEILLFDQSFTRASSSSPPKRRPTLQERLTTVTISTEQQIERKKVKTPSPKGRKPILNLTLPEAVPGGSGVKMGKTFSERRKNAKLKIESLMLDDAESDEPTEPVLEESKYNICIVRRMKYQENERINIIFDR